MIKKIWISSAALSLSLLGTQANACLDHYYGDGGNGGFFNSSQGAAALRNLPKKEKIFKVKHPRATLVTTNEDANIEIDYDLPPKAKNVSLQFTANDNVEMLDQDIELEGLNGTATARFRVKEKGVDIITVTVSGEHEGEILSYSSTVYINAKPATPS